MITKHKVSIALVWAAASTVSLGIAATNIWLNFPLELTIGFVALEFSIAAAYTIGVINFIAEMKQRHGPGIEDKL